MRLALSLAVLATLLPAGSLAAPMLGPAEDGEAVSSPTIRGSSVPIKKCRSATARPAQAASAWRGRPVQMKRLHELPPGTAYKAVYRTVDGCELPMTIAEYGTGPTR
jgi:hypothetical protein